MITNRPKRLAGVSYVGFQRYFVTTCTAFRKPIFKNDVIATSTTTTILTTAATFGFAIPAYCLMPDHIHLLLAAQTETADVPAFMKQAKQLSGFAYRQATGESLWQTGYHDRILRDDEATLAVARYVLENPVRAGLTQVLGEWPYAGSSCYTWPELRTAWEDATRTREGQT